MFEPYIEPESPANQENTPLTTEVGGESPVYNEVKETIVKTPTKTEPLKPSPIKNIQTPSTFKKQMAGKSLKASLLDAFNDAVFGFPKPKRRSFKRPEPETVAVPEAETEAEKPTEPLQENKEEETQQNQQVPVTTGS